MKTHTSAWKKKQLADTTALFKKYPVIAIASLERFPASLFQVLRKKLVGKAVVKVTKTKIVGKALKESGLKSIDALDSYVDHSIGVIFTEMNPFELYAFLKKSKGRTSAKPGMPAPEDIVVPAGDTGLPPGPALSDLKAAGLNPRIQGSTIFVPKDVVVTKKGEAVTKIVASTLSKLNIKPISVGLNVLAAYEKGEVYKAEVLNVEIDEVFAKFVLAQQQSINLSVNAEFFTKQTTDLIIGKAFNEAKAVALETKFLDQAQIDALTGKAEKKE